MKIDVLIGCEESGVVTEAFRKRGINAWSCDLLPTSGRLPMFHIQDDVLKVISEHPEIRMLIAFPPCTHLAVSGAKHFEQKRKDGRQQQGIDFFMALVNLHIEMICIENPVGIMSTLYRKPDQIIQPWQFGHGETKATCLWLYGLPKLQPTKIVEGREQKIWKMSPGPERAKLRSKTYSGIAHAFADQYSKFIESGISVKEWEASNII